MLSFAVLVITVSVIFQILASLFDLKTGEIPEGVNYGYVFLVLAISAVDAFSSADASLLIDTIIMGAAFFAVGFMLFYLGQWGGGDVKLMAGIGGSMGYLAHVGSIPQAAVFPFYVTYFVNMGFIAFPYVLIYGLILGIGNKRTGKEFLACFGNRKIQAFLVLSLTPSIAAVVFNLYQIAVLYLLIPPLVIAALYLKAVEKTALQDEVAVSELREGDVVAQDLYAGTEKIASRRDIEGFSSEDLAKVKKLAEEQKIPGKIMIKRGIKFAPVLFLSYVTVIFIGNFMEMAFRAFA